LHFEHFQRRFTLHLSTTIVAKGIGMGLRMGIGWLAAWFDFCLLTYLVCLFLACFSTMYVPTRRAAGAC
jgi:hypothetical protein